MRESLMITKEQAIENLYTFLHPTESTRNGGILANAVNSLRLPRPVIYSIFVKSSRSGLQRTYRFLTLVDGKPRYLSRSIAALLDLRLVEDAHGDGIRRSYLDPEEIVSWLSEKLYGDSAKTPNRLKVLEHVSL